jgi:uncharacterized membrane protein
LIGVLWGSLAALAWGLAYFISRDTIRALGTIRSLLFGELISLVWLTVYLSLSGQFGGLIISNNGAAWGFAVLAVLINSVSTLFFTRAIEIGVLSIVIPISSTYAAFTVLFALLAGELLALVQLIGITLALIGVVLAIPRRDEQQPAQTQRDVLRGALFALASAAGYGLGFWMLGFFVTPVLGSIAPVWIGRITMLGVVVIAIGMNYKRVSLALPARPIWLPLIVSTILGNLALIANNTGYAAGYVAIVSVFASLYSAVTVVPARLFLHERLNRVQWIGLGLILVSVPLVIV